jgi:hypothetical protein
MLVKNRTNPLQYGISLSLATVAQVILSVPVPVPVPVHTQQLTDNNSHNIIPRLTETESESESDNGHHSSYAMFWPRWLSRIPFLTMFGRR